MEIRFTPGSQTLRAIMTSMRLPTGAPQEILHILRIFCSLLMEVFQLPSTYQLRQSANYSISQSLLNKNDTIGDLSADFLQVIQTMSALLEELTSQILLIIGAVIIAVCLVIGSLYIFNKSFHSFANQALGRVSKKALAGGYSKKSTK